MDSHPSRTGTGLHWIPATVLAGLAGGLLACLFDALLLRAALAYWTLPNWPILLAHAGGGLAVGLVALAAAFVLPSNARRSVPPWAFALVGSVLYGVSLWERLTGTAAVSRRVPDWIVAVAAAVALAVLLFVFARIGSAAGRAWYGAWMAGFSMALLQVGNRTVVEEPLAPSSLVLDVGCMVLALVLLVVLRSRWRGSAVGRTAGLLGSSLAAALVALVVVRLACDAVGGLPDPDTEVLRRDDPDVLLLVFDTMRGDVFRDVLENTPEGEAFAEALGPVTWFPQHTAVAASTPPTMSTILSGLYPPQHGVDGSAARNWQLRIHRDVALLPQVLGRRGYQSLAYVANRALRRSIGVHRGVDRFLALNTATQAYPLGMVMRRFFDLTGSRFALADQARRIAVAELERQHDPRRPTLLWYHLMDTHQPLVEHPDLPPTPVDAGLTAEQLLYRDAARFALRETATAVEAFRRFLSPDDTLTLVVADHGEMLVADGHTAPGTDLRKGHSHSFFESLVNVPLGIQLPGLGRHSQPPASGALVSQVDLLPTLVEVLGLDWPRALPGCSLMPYLQGSGEGPPCRQFAVASANVDAPRHRAFRTPQLKVMVPDEEGAFAPRLYELEIDPGETSDRAEEEPGALAAAISLLDQFWTRFEGERSGKPADLDEDTIRTLEGLGYLQ